MERYNVHDEYMTPSEAGNVVLHADAQRALDAEREKVKRLSTCGTDHSTPWWQVKCEDLEAQLATLQAQVKQLDRTLADVYQQRDGLQAQLRQVEGAYQKLLNVIDDSHDEDLPIEIIEARDEAYKFLAAKDAGKAVSSG